MMPVVDEAAMLRNMTEDASLNGIPVVIMSGILEPTVAKRCSGYVAFMRKPFRINDVVRLSKRLVSRGGAASRS
jgi:hypothetical protein